jgi:hypothetical protein
MKRETEHVRPNSARCASRSAAICSAVLHPQSASKHAISAISFHGSPADGCRLQHGPLGVAPHPSFSTSNGGPDLLPAIRRAYHRTRISIHLMLIGSVAFIKAAAYLFAATALLVHALAGLFKKICPPTILVILLAPWDINTLRRHSAARACAHWSS